MKKIITIILLCLMSLYSSAFRVTKDHGNGIKTFEDSKKKTYGVSVDGGNTWIRDGRVSSSTSTTSRNEELSPEAQALLDKAMEIYNNMMESGQIYVVRGSVVDLYGKRLTLNAKDKVGSMGKDWDNADKFVYLKTLSGVKFKKPEKRLTIEQIRFNRLKRNVFGHVETEEEPSELYKISQTSVSISEWRGNEYGNTRKWKTIYSGYLMEAIEYIILNIVLDGCSRSSLNNNSDTTTEHEYIAPKMFKASMPKLKPVVYKCKCEIDDYYNYEFDECQKTHWSVDIKAYKKDGSNYESFHGYVLKSSALGRKISSILSDGDEHEMTLVIRYTSKSESSDIVEIINMK